MVSTDNVRKFSDFEEFGFNAGISLKSTWIDKTEIIEFIKNDIVGVNYNFVIPKQVHSSEIMVIDKILTDDELICDGMISNNPNTCLAISSADCVPVLFADKSGWYGALHIGWRGFIGCFLDNFETLINEKDIDISQIKITIGPSIGACCYEVGDEVSILFDNSYLETSEQNVRLNLKKAVVNKFLSMGVSENNLNISEECTSCDSERFYSYRRDGKSPIQMISYIARINK